MRRDSRRDTTPRYQGRPLPRPDEDVVDQGLGFDLGTLLGRRQVLRAFGLGAATLGLAACSANTAASGGTSAAAAAAAATGEIPDETAGPYPGDGSNGPDVLEQSGVVRSDIRSSFGESSGTADGVPLTLELTVTDLANNGTPFTGVAVYVWHCDREGRYSMYSEGVTDQNYLRGVQITDTDGKVTFTTIFPACYTGRWPHIHFEVYPDEASITDAGNAIATSQVALPQDVCDTVYAEPAYDSSVTNLAQLSLDTDNVFGDDGGASQLATVTGDVSAGYAATLAVPVDTTTAPTGGGAAPGGGGPAGGGPGGAPPSGMPS
ncbi:intradiol ring-cleavage dioxygenase [Solwaraspora sp. WMMA2080]|uniref:intradiol ring-cleavage dioxygenase n=1 Tax=unclassified Solwaraspora TaxID=2627926 RepID=UPI00248BA940|nr:MULTISPECIES: intradiol ring-cleavage dioxygenase [unclassified Solwaraspora]WBB95067.1 intradiol ring-cleavage dioxygenase [Solwaraspora sp. WMMA2059]WBC21049.1 intradiol ring-cleavage dioxygenase [Solwaraspora sp. WMMA2080]